MTTGNKTSFSGEVAVHIDIKYHVASNILVSGEDLTTPHLLHCVIAFLKSNPHIIHILLNGNSPKVSPRGLINILGFFDRLGNSDSKIVGFLSISCLDFGNDTISLMHYILNPSLEHSLFLQLVSHCVFSKLHGIGMFQINQGHTFRRSSLPLYFQSPTSCCLLCLHIALFSRQKPVGPVNCK